ncbi:alpha-L-glutamate ligase-like protein [Spongorhabdus nitratireducens]
MNLFKWFARPHALLDAGVLSMNRRNLCYVSRYNKRSLLPLVDDKLSTKRLAEKAGVAVPKLLGVIQYQHDVQQLHKLLDHLSEFVIKPANGSGGKGILVITGRDGSDFVKGSGEKLGFADVKRHVTNTLGGLYSLGGKTDVALIESLIRADPVFERYSHEGVPDIRTIVFKGYPVMAMLRLATKASDGKANLHQGAVGVGLDMASGQSLRAVQFDQPVTHHPDTMQDFSALSVPHWKQLLTLTARCYEMTGLGYLGVDMVLDQNEGPLILELNARPGLAIQIANGSGLRSRLEMIETLKSGDNAVSERVTYAMTHFSHF